MTMALADPYAPCPCGSEKKYKWCCQKGESYIERAQRQVESNQLEAAISILNEGLARHPDTPWLLLRKSLLLAALHRPEEAKQCCSLVLRHQPDHLGAAILQVRMTLMGEGPVAAASELQQALSRVKPEDRPGLFRVAATVADQFARAHLIPAALRHYELAIGLDEEAESAVASAVRTLRGDPEISPWLKQPYELSPPPEGLGTAAREQFERAVGWEREGLLESAAAAFELLAAESRAAPGAERNLGLCRLWLGDQPAAASALRRFLARAGGTPEAVDLAVLCHLINPVEDPEPIEQVHLTWPLRDREALVKILAAQDSLSDAGPRPRDPHDEDSPEVASYHWLDRPSVEPRAGLAREQVPLILADILVGQDQVTLETFDDGRLNGLIDRFTALVGKSVPPAHPRTKVLQRFPRSEYALSWHWRLPDELTDDEKIRLSSEQSAHIINAVWPDTPLETLGGRTPIQAARGGKHEVALRAELLRLESSAEDWSELVDWQRLRGRLGLPAEPENNLQTVDIDRVALGRLFKLSVSALDDDRLARLYNRAHEYGLHILALRAAHEIVGRPRAGFEETVDPIALHAMLAMESSSRGDQNEAMGWLARGRTWGDARLRAECAPHWDMLEIQIRALQQKPEEWVPELAVVLERYRDNERAGMVLTSRMLEMGLLRLGSSPDRPGELMLDPRPLQQLLSLYGPKVTTSSGYLGVSATKGEIWTPDSAAKGSSTIWTPGSDVGSTGDKPRIIVTGQ
jgi:tetratricopeptide (TPR) repeat protein